MAPRLVSSRISFRFSLFSPLSKLHFHYCQAIHFHSIIFPNFHIYLFAFSNEDTKRRDEPPSSAAAAAAARLMATNCQNVNEPKCLQGVGGGGRHFDGGLDCYRAQSSTNFWPERGSSRLSGNDFQLAAKHCWADWAYLCERRVRFGQIMRAADKGRGREEGR